MNPFHDFPRFKGTCYGTSFYPAINIVDKDMIEIENVVTSPSLQKPVHQNFLAIRINSGLFCNDAAPIEEDSSSQCFSRLQQRVIFNFLTEHGGVEKLPCSEISDKKELYAPSQKISTLEKNHQDVIMGVIPNQQSIFNFLNGNVSQCLFFLVDFHLDSNFGLDTCGDLSRCLSHLNLKNSPDKSACFDNTRQNVQDNGPCSTVSHELPLTDHHALEHLTTDPTVKMNGFTEVIDGNIHLECSFSTSNPFFDSPLHYYQKTFNSVKVSDIVIESGLEANQSYLIENLTGMLSKSNCNAEIFEQTTTTYQENLPDSCQHPANGNSVESTFAIPDPDELFEYLHGTLSSPKLLTSDPLNRESDSIQFSLHLGYCSSDEGAKSDNLSDSITNPCGDTVEIDNEYGMLDTLGYGIGSEIGAMTGGFGEIETPDTPSLPEQSQIEQIRWNRSSQDVDFSHFDFDDYEDLLELYGLNEQDVQTNYDEFCDSPTWPGKRFIQESELEYQAPISASATETNSTSEIAGTITAGNITETCSRSYMDSSSDYWCKIVSQSHEERHENSASRIYYHQSFDDVSDTDGSPENYKNAVTQHGNTASFDACGPSGHSFGYFQEYPVIECDEELKFTFPDPDEVMEFLHGSLTSPKFLEVKNLNEDSVKLYYSPLFDNKSSSEAGIGVMAGVFGETETPDTPSIPEQSQVEKVRWNWANRDVDSSCFNFGNHEELLELYGLKQQDVQANDDEFCDSPTWPGKE